MSNFEKSKFYKEALQKYREELYKDIYKPNNVIVDSDCVFLFYPQDKVIEIFNILIKEYEKEDSEIGIHLGFDLPELIDYTFMNIKYQAIYLWYDNEISLIPKFK